MAKKNAKSQCGGKIAKKQQQKKSKPKACCKKTLCARCKRKIAKRKRCPKSPSYYNLFVAYIHRRLKSKNPAIEQCEIMKKAAMCWKKLTAEQKADFKRRCDAGEIKTGKGREYIPPRSPRNPGSNGGGDNGCGGCSNNSGPPQVSWSSFSPPPLPSFLNSNQPNMASSTMSQQPSKQMPLILRAEPFPMEPPSSYYVSMNKSFP